MTELSAPTRHRTGDFCGIPGRPVLRTIRIDRLRSVLLSRTRLADETDEQLGVLVAAAFGLMGDVLGPVGRALTRLPAGDGHPGRTAGPTFQMYYEMGNFVPWRHAAWTLLAERAALLADRAERVAGLPGVPARVAAVAGPAAAIAARLAAHARA